MLMGQSLTHRLSPVQHLPTHLLQLLCTPAAPEEEEEELVMEALGEVEVISQGRTEEDEERE